MKALMTAGLLLFAIEASAQVSPIQWLTEGVKNSTLETTNCPSPMTGKCIAAGVVMAQTAMDLSTLAAGWAISYACHGAPVTEAGVLVGGAGAYYIEKYTAGGSGAFLGLITHPSMGQGGTQSLPPLLFASGEGVRIKTLIAQKGFLSCDMQIYVF